MGDQAESSVRRGAAARAGGGGGTPWGYQGGKPPLKRACYNFNEGACNFRELCRYCHICVKCDGDHPAVSCKAVITRPEEKSWTF